jgi:signal recognition particle subunit SRP54
MLETLTRGFETARDRLRGVRTLSEENVDEALRDVRVALLEADVDFQVTKDFLARVKERALGEKVETRARDASGRTLRVTPGQHFVKVCQDELTALMGPVDPSLARDDAGITSVMLIGLQGVGKTTVAAKLGRHLGREGRRPLLVAADVQRPAAVLQLQQLGERIGAAVHVGAAGEAAPAICAQAAERARREGFGAVVYDTAGRLAIDDDLMRELEEVRAATRPANVLLVCDALMGRDAVQVARTFTARLPLDGLVLTKLDGDARGGAAVAVKAATGVPIKFLGTGESVDRLEPFRPEGLASAWATSSAWSRTSRRWSTSSRPRRTPSGCCAASSPWTTCWGSCAPSSAWARCGTCSPSCRCSGPWRTRWTARSSGGSRP